MAEHPKRASGISTTVATLTENGGGRQMTLQEAEAFIEEAQELPIDRVDLQLLEAAITALSKELEGKSLIGPEAETLRTAQAMAALVGLTPSVTQAEGDPVLTTSEILSGDFPKLPDLVDLNVPRPIGVPLDFVASREGPVGNIDRLGTVNVPPRYFEGDEFDPASLDPNLIIRWQKRLVAAGLIDEGEYTPGYWDDLSMAAYKKVLGYANLNAQTDLEAVDRLIQTLPQSVKDARAKAKQLEVFSEPPYITPDYATLAQGVKGYFRERMGRDPTDAELSELTGMMNSLYRQQFDVGVEADRIVFEGGAESVTPPALTFGQPLPEGQPPALSFGGRPATPVGSRVLQGVDPEARFLELFEKRFKPEVDRLDSLSEVRRNANNVFNSLRTMTSLIGGGR